MCNLRARFGAVRKAKKKREREIYKHTQVWRDEINPGGEGGGNKTRPRGGIRWLPTYI